MAKDVFLSKDLLSNDQFEEVYWGAIRHLCSKVYPSTFLAWYVKHVFRCSGTMHDLYRNDTNIPKLYESPGCPCCDHHDETADHIILCTEQGRTNLYHDSVNDLVRWMKKEQTHPTIVLLVRGYLNARGTKTMVEVWTSAGGRRDDAQLGSQIAVAHDKLGWTNFVEGRISKKYVEVQTDHILSNTNSRRRRKLSAKWASGFVDGIIRITHRQWLYRNEYIHYTHQYGSESPLERRRSLARITHLHEHTDPDDLLPNDHYLLIRISTKWLCGIQDNETSSRPSSGHLALAEQQARSERTRRRRARLGVNVQSRQHTRRPT